MNNLIERPQIKTFKDEKEMETKLINFFKEGDIKILSNMNPDSFYKSCPVACDILIETSGIKICVEVKHTKKYGIDYGKALGQLLTAKLIFKGDKMYLVSNSFLSSPYLDALKYYGVKLFLFDGGGINSPRY